MDLYIINVFADLFIWYCVAVVVTVESSWFCDKFVDCFKVMVSEDFYEFSVGWPKEFLSFLCQGRAVAYYMFCYLIVLLGSVIAFLSSKRQRSVFGAICLLYDCIAWQCNRPSALISQVEGSYPPDKSVKRVKGALHPNTLINTTQPLELPRQPHEEVRLRFRCPKKNLG